jgi:hypothetical protein
MDRLGILAAVEQADMKSFRAPRRALIALEPEAKGMGRIQEEILGRIGQHHMRIAQIERDVARPGPLLPKRFRQCLGIGEGLAEE